MTFCFSAASFALFLSITGLSITGAYPLWTVQADRPAVYVETGGRFCHGGERV